MSVVSVTNIRYEHSGKKEADKRHKLGIKTKQGNIKVWKLPKSETAPHPGWQDGTILEQGSSSSLPTFLANCLLSFVMMSTAVGDQPLKVSSAIGRKVKPSAALLSSYFFDFNS